MNRRQVLRRLFSLSLGPVLSAVSASSARPGIINPEQAQRLKDYWDAHFSGNTITNNAVVSDGLTYSFHIPVHNVGIYNPANISALNEDYYAECLEHHVRAVDKALKEGIGS